MLRKEKLNSFLKKLGIELRYVKGNRIIKDLSQYELNVISTLLDEVEGIILALSDFSPKMITIFLKRCEKIHMNLLNKSFQHNLSES